MAEMLFFFFFLTLTRAIDDPSIRIYDIDQFPDFDISDIVEFYYLEASFPFTAPPEIVQKSGDQWTQYSLSHSGLGIWNKDRHLKLSLELVCMDYVGALLPTLVSVNEYQTLTWNNTGSIVLTRPLNETFWAESRLLAVSNGGAYKDLVQYLKDHKKRYAKYQPVTIVEDITEALQVSATDSYAFVEDIFDELVEYRLPLSTFLQIKRSYFSYLAVNSETPLTKISWTTFPPANVTDWYRNLTRCYKRVWEQNDAGASIFLVLVHACYSSGYAFVYDTDNSVYQVDLAAQLTPSFYRRDLELPEVSDSKSPRWDITDSVITVLFVSLFLSGFVFCIYHLFTKKTKRSPGEAKDDEDVSNIVDEIIRARNTGYQPRPSPGMGSTHEHGKERDDINSMTKRDTLYQYFNRRSEQHDREPSTANGLSLLSIFSSFGGKKPLLPNNSVSDHYTAFLPPMEESPPPLSHPPSLPTTPSSSLRLSQGSIQSQHTTQRNSFAPTATSPPPLNSTPDDFINFIQQPTTRVYSSTSSTSLPLQGNEREKSLSDETGEKGVRLSSPPLQTSANIRSSKNEEFPF